MFVSVPQIIKRLQLRIHQRLHWIDDEGRDPVVGRRPPDQVIDDRQEIGQALARICPAGDDIAFLPTRQAEGLSLVPEQVECFPF